MLVLVFEGLVVPADVVVGGGLGRLVVGLTPYLGFGAKPNPPPA